MSEIQKFFFFAMLFVILLTNVMITIYLGIIVHTIVVTHPYWHH